MRFSWNRISMTSFRMGSSPEWCTPTPRFSIGSSAPTCAPGARNLLYFPRKRATKRLCPFRYAEVGTQLKPASIPSKAPVWDLRYRGAHQYVVLRTKCA